MEFVEKLMKQTSMNGKEKDEFLVQFMEQLEKDKHDSSIDQKIEVAEYCYNKVV